MWVAVFACRATTYIHAEVMSSCSTTSFANAFTRFTALYAKPASIRSDRGSQIMAYYRSVQSWLEKNHVTWECALAGAPATNGSAESAVKILKRQLAVLAASTLAHEEFETLVRRAQLQCNRRPIGYSGEGDPQVVTPFHFHGGGLGDLPEEAVPDVNMQIGERRKWMESQTDGLWKVLQETFFPRRLRRTAKGKLETLKEGDVVAVRELNQARGLWTLGKVHKPFYSRDGRVRAAEVMIGSSTTNPKLMMISSSRMALIARADHTAGV